MRRRIRRRFSVPCERPLRIEESLAALLREGRFRKTFFPLLPATFLSAVVAYELSVNAQDRRTPSLLREFIHPMERTGRVVTPTFDDWLKASAVMSAVGRGTGPGDPSCRVS